MRPQKLPNGTFLTQLRDPLGGPRISVRGDTEAECIALAHEVRALRNRYKLGLMTPEGAFHIRALAEGPLSARAAWEEALAKKTDARQRRQYQNTWRDVFEPIFGDLPVMKIDEQRCKAWEAWIVKKGGREPSTIWQLWCLFRAAINKQIPKRVPHAPWGSWVPEAKAQRGPRDERRRPALQSIEELRAVFLHARRKDERLRGQWVTKGFADLEYRLTVMTLCGLRNGELGALGWDDIRFDDDEQTAILTIRHQVKSKWKTDHPEWSRPLDPPKDRRDGRLDKPQRVHPDAVMALLAQRAQLEALGWYRADGPVFPNPTSKDGAWRLDEETVDPRHARECAREAGRPDWEKFVTHSMRHTFSTLEAAGFKAQGGNIRDLMERTRHRDIATAQGYIHSVGVGLLPPGIPRVAMPALPGVTRTMAEVSEGVFEPVLDPPRIEAITKERGEAIEAERAIARIQREEKRFTAAGVAELNFQAEYERWVAAGAKGVRPASITEHLNKRYMAAYQKTKRDARKSGRDPESPDVLAEAQRAGIASKRGSERRWARTIKENEKAGRGLAKGPVGNGHENAANETDGALAPRDLRSAPRVRGA